jgi:selenocysteine lyase/cysteine desulfurase
MPDRRWPILPTEAWSAREFKAARFIRVGARSPAVLEGIVPGIRFAEAIGPARIYHRVHQLARRAHQQAADFPELELMTRDDDHLFGGLVAFRTPRARFERFAAKAPAEKMWSRGSSLMRLATHIHSRPKDVDQFFTLLRQRRQE